MTHASPQSRQQATSHRPATPVAPKALMALLWLVLGDPAHAADTAHWGDGTAALICTPPTATITVHNWMGGSQDRLWVLLTCPGLQVGMEVIHGPGREPDHIIIKPPAGFMSIPVDAMVPEDGNVRFLIVPLDGALS